MPGHTEIPPHRPLIALLFELAAGASMLRWRRYEIADRSMMPTLAPGDWALGLARPRGLDIGDVVVCDLPGRPGFEITKRVASVDANGALWLVGDAPHEGSVDSRSFGAVKRDAITARLVLVYRPRPMRRLR